MSFTYAKIVCKDANPADYHRQDCKRGDAGFVIGSSALRDFASCPARWLAGYEAPESEAKRYGSLLDCLALTPGQFDKRYAVQPSHYTRDGEKKEWRNDLRIKDVKEWAEANVGKILVKADSIEEATGAIQAMRNDETIANWFDVSDRQVWIGGLWEDKDGVRIPVRALIDFVPRLDSEFAKCLGDLKTTRNAALLVWSRFCYQMGYHVQAAFHTDLYVAATGEDRNTWCFVLSENYAPWQPAKRMLSQDFLTLGREEYTRHLENYCACLKANKWPGYDDHDESVQGWSIVNPEPWQAERAAFAPHYEFGQAAIDAEPEPREDDFTP